MFEVTLLLLPIRMGNSTVGIGVDMSSSKIALDTRLFFLPIRSSSNLIRTNFGEYVSSQGKKRKRVCIIIWIWGRKESSYNSSC